MASLVDSRPSPPSIPLPQSQSPPIKTTTNTFPPAQPTGSTPSPYHEIPGAFPHDTARPSPRQETSRGQASQSLGARRTSLPSTEREGVKPGEHYDGVGPLPGTISETSVAKLPDERIQAAREADQPVSPPSGLRESIGVPDERATAETSETPAAGTGTESQKPTSDTTESTAPAHAEQRIVSPETGDQNVISQAPAQQVLERGDRGPDAGANRTQEDPADAKSKEEDAAIKEERKDERKGEEYREPPQRAAEEGASAKQQQQEERAKSISTSEPDTAAVPPTSTSTQRKGRSGRSSSDSDASHHKKASVMNMVKGEMKVLLGKASRNKGKVEEGEKLKKQGAD